MEIGDILKQTREAKGYSLADAEEATKIRARYLEALENEQFELLPGQVYVIAFLRNYARFLGLDDNQLVQQYKGLGKPADVPVDEPEVKTSTATEKPAPARRTRRPKRKVAYFPFVAVAAVILAVVLGISWAYKSLPSNDKAKPPQVVEEQNKKPPSVTTPNDKKETPKVPGTTKPDQQATAVELVLNVTEANCWMKVDVDGQTAFEGTASPGDVKEFSGQEKINVVLGNAGAVEVKYNGEDIGKLGASGSIAEREFKSKEG
jgi:cytoskeletal protein RodZ